MSVKNRTMLGTLVGLNNENKRQHPKSDLVEVRGVTLIVLGNGLGDLSSSSG